MRLRGNLLWEVGFLLALVQYPALLGARECTFVFQSQSQSPTKASPAFEVATIKPVPPGSRRHWGFRSLPGGRIEIGGITIKQLMAVAFHLPQSGITGGPSWIDSSVFSISAVPPENSPSRTAPPPRFDPTEEQQLMLQALLIDRLSLRIHYTTIEGSIYLLSKGKGSLKLEPPKDMNRTPAFVLSMAGTTFDGEARAATASMKDVAETLSSDLDTPVEDKTGLSGRYDFYVEPFAPENDSVEVAAVGAMHRLGLELRKTKAPVKVMVIDSIQSPSPN